MRALYLEGHLTEPQLLSRHPGFLVHHLSHEYLDDTQYTKALIVKPGEQVPADLIQEPSESHFIIPSGA